jgi:hypothetical protein
MKLPLSRLLLAAVAVTALAGPAYAGPSSPEVPATLVPQAGNKVFLVAHAEGVQIYRCDAVTSAWTLVAPRANLYADNGKLLGTHSAGPRWEALDGSYVTAAKVDGVNVDPTAVDWLLLAKKTSAAGAEGSRLTDTTYIQRINTTGGRAPAASECDVTGETAEIDYTADYYFWKKDTA